METQKEVYTATNDHCGSMKAFATDEPSKGDGTRHHYKVTHEPQPGGPVIDLGVIKFQNGIPGEVGVNGMTDEALLSILADHVEGFQRGPCNCEANRNAAWSIREALRWLKTRSVTQRGSTPPKEDT